MVDEVVVFERVTMAEAYVETFDKDLYQRKAGVRK